MSVCTCQHHSWGRSSPKETYSTSLCEGSHTPTAIMASVLEGGSCGQVLNEVLAKVLVTVGPQWVIVIPSTGHWSDWDPACVVMVKDMAVGKSRGNLDAAPAPPREQTTDCLRSLEVETWRTWGGGGPREARG